MIETRREDAAPRYPASARFRHQNPSIWPDQGVPETPSFDAGGLADAAGSDPHGAIHVC